ncbi:putative nuclease HARBI1 [Linepithema humile]|uniref:putative nuclease HARBI1 n=1 Tax=Linepithema humile TaxID=83485 RepID=UPI00351ED383
MCAAKGDGFSVYIVYIFCNISKDIITFPLTSEEKHTVAENFKKIFGFDRVIGCIDGSYINIRTPAHKSRTTYANRYHTTSIVLQAVCDDRKRFLDVFTGVPGKLHDSRTFKLSFLKQNIEEICENGSFHLLGDSAYPIREFLMTPYKDFGNLTPSHIKFNEKLSATRVKIENAFGLLKGRFRQLMLLDFHTVYKMSRFIIACCVLHNMCIDSNDLFRCDDVLNEEQFNEPVELEDNETILRQQGERKRDEIRNRMNR